VKGRPGVALALGLGIVYLDGAGRQIRVRERTTQLSGEQLDPWFERRYSYPSSLDIKHPRPVCPT
jgi:hypothetical protein